MSDQPGAFIWYELMTSDPDAAKSFYDSVIGWDIEPCSSAAEAGLDYRMIRRSDGGFAGGMLALSAEMIAAGAKPGWFGYIHVPDVDATAAALVASGGKIYQSARDLEGVGRFAMVDDPWGAPFYLMNPTPPANAPDAQSDVFSVDQPQHVRWNELQSGDSAAAITLYCDLFGWNREGEMEMGPLGTYRFVACDGIGIGAICNTMPGNSDGPRWTHYIGVDDIDRAVAAVIAGGGQIIDGPQEIPGGEFSVDIRDPHGASAGLVGPRKAGG
ncbi:VOC family protein [Tsuneonella suprasediminis]|uniref:VOC family protein n=1 Tax=Tsuneonella suprasediminis TaxID=2306996 RepID=A0A419R3M3_9SPHN|nr:VOC family protein [Tsuneonella suprasediminis]RJX68550.1 VOC family protein [Tsuneonella suprasediminis]